MKTLREKIAELANFSIRRKASYSASIGAIGYEKIAEYARYLRCRFLNEAAALRTWHPACNAS